MGKQRCNQTGRPKGTVKKNSNIARYWGRNNTQLNTSPNANPSSPTNAINRNRQNKWESLPSDNTPMSLSKNKSIHHQQPLSNMSLSNEESKQKRVSNRELNSITENLFPLDSEQPVADTLDGDKIEVTNCELEGNRLLPIMEIKNAVKKTLTCSNCVQSNQSKEEKNLKLLFSEISNLILPDDNDKKEQLKNIFKKHKKRLQHMKSDLSLHENTVGLATDLECFCSRCDLLFEIKSQRTCFKPANNRICPNESYQLNCLFVFALQLVGGGCIDAHILLSFLNLPHGKSMESGKFNCIEQKLSPVICEITEKVLDQALEEEVYLQLKAENRVSDFVNWKKK